MNRRFRWSIVVMVTWVAFGCSSGPAGHGDQKHDAGEAPSEQAEPRRGPQGGRLFGEGDIRLEIWIQEAGGPPVFIAQLLDPDGKPLPVGEATLSAAMRRFAGRTERITFRPLADRFKSDQVIGEPHSFRVELELSQGGHRETWSWEQVEGRVELSPEAVAAGEIETEIAGPRSIEVRVKSPGEVRLNLEHLVQVRPRYPGVITRMLVSLGDNVSPGDTLAHVRSSESLVEYAITSPKGGTIVSKQVADGSAVDREDVLCTVADLSSVYVDFTIYPQHAGLIRKGNRARVTASSYAVLASDGVVNYVGPLLDHDTRASYSRIILPNRDGRWQPGLYVNVDVTVEEVDVPVAVLKDSIVRSRFGPALFVAEGSTFELQPVTLGRSDSAHVEILEGLPAGIPVVVRNAFVLKAELGKSEATHDH